MNLLVSFLLNVNRKWICSRGFNAFQQRPLNWPVHVSCFHCPVHKSCKNLVKIIFLYKSFFFFFWYFICISFWFTFTFSLLYILLLLLCNFPQCVGLLKEFYSILFPNLLLSLILFFHCFAMAHPLPHRTPKKNIYPQSKKPKRWHNIVSTFSPLAGHNLIIVLWARVLLLWPSWCQNDNTLPALSCTQQDVASRPVWSVLRCQRAQRWKWGRRSKKDWWFQMIDNYMFFTFTHQCKV